ncbi:MAG: DUF1579 domain-containing protein [Planctomycetota bacterium]|nr:MAG: DUF1579 domain-containing protein [Planctomycetota bacterium]
MLPKSAYLALLIVAPLAAAGLTAAALSRDQAPQDPAAMMAKPTAEHEVLKLDEGTWKAQTKFWMAPNQEPEAGTGVETNTMSLNGLWLVSDYKDDSGMFAGHGVAGYDTQKKKYVGAWVDTMTTHLGLSEGTWDKGKKTMTWTGEGTDMATGKPAKFRTVVTYPDAKTRHAEAFMTGADGKEWKNLEIHYTRS